MRKQRIIRLTGSFIRRGWELGAFGRVVFWLLGTINESKNSIVVYAKAIAINKLKTLIP
ncbi:MAG: hypothetical protein QNJ38_00180 [Prochloraceae cyanobacterium]|nr:hypothetical protein [Prochloraceae cyanobacterium]